MKIGIVVSDYNKEITHAMLDVVEKYAKEKKLELGSVIHVAGVFDIPLAVQKILDDVDGVVTLGAVIQGGTSHDELVAHTTAKTLQEISLRFGKPIGLGISGPRMSKKQAEERIECTAKQAVDAVVSLNK